MQAQAPQQYRPPPGQQPGQYPPPGQYRPPVTAPPPTYKPPEHSANFVLVRIAVGKEDSAYNNLRQIPGISGIHQVYGEYDIVLIIRERESRNFRNLVMKKIRGVDGVVETTTLIAAD